jgi:hypothetical protein
MANDTYGVIRVRHPRDTNADGSPRDYQFAFTDKTQWRYALDHLARLEAVERVEIIDSYWGYKVHSFDDDFTGMIDIFFKKGS